MRKIYKPLAVIPLFLALAGCQSSETTKVPAAEQDNYPKGIVTIKGKPSGKGINYSELGGIFSCVICVNGKYVLAATDAADQSDTSLNPHQIADAYALFDSELNDGDNEDVELTGRYENGKFKMHKLKAQGYEVKFYNPKSTK